MPKSMATDIAITKENSIHELYFYIYIIHRRDILDRLVTATGQLTLQSFSHTLMIYLNNIYNLSFHMFEFHLIHSFNGFLSFFFLFSFSALFQNVQLVYYTQVASPL